MYEIMDHPVKTIDVFKLSEYIDIMSDRTYGNYYYRGENKLFESNNSSSILRHFTKPNNKYLPDFYNDILSGFYREVANSVTNVEKEHFIAFCQHHGLKTNLIDFTTSPIIALYFACDMNNEFLENNIGYIYMIDKEKCIDVSNSLLKSKSDNILIPFFLENILYGSDECILEFAKVIRRYIQTDNGEIFYLANYLRDCCNNLDIRCQSREYLNRIAECTKGIDDTQFLEIIKKVQDEYSHKFNLEEITMYSAKDFMILLKMYLHDVVFLSRENSDREFIFPRLPYFVYQTPYKFDRIKNQEALFIYQLFLNTTSPLTDDVHKTIIQKIEPDVIIRIHNQETILRELDSIGINRKLIYGDYDNIAKYINDKFLNEIKQ